MDKYGETVDGFLVMRHADHSFTVLLGIAGSCTEDYFGTEYVHFTYSDLNHTGR